MQHGAQEVKDAIEAAAPAAEAAAGRRRRDGYHATRRAFPSEAKHATVRDEQTLTLP
jgi:hypothetical protein